ncbi:MAG: serpin family protein [Clostridiales bacterium]|nr:serpin family protein [Clostridiales bacterium]
MNTKKLMAGLLTSSLLLSMTTGCAKKKTEDSKISRNNNEMETAVRPAEQTAIFELMNAGSGNYTEEQKEELKKEYSKFIFGVLNRCLKAAQGKNVMISSDSILFALEMAAAGANGETLDQMLMTMIPGASNEEAFRFAVDRMKHLQSEELSVANSAWVNQVLDGVVYDDYLNYVKNNFDAEVQMVPFDDKLVDTINGWVCEKTDGMIKQLIDHVNPDAMMFLINAITFDAKWAEPFEESSVKPGEFTLSDGTKQEVTFLHGKSDALYLHNDKAQGIAKSYEGGKYAFITILPDDEKADINDFMADFTPDEYWEFWDSRSEQGDYTLIYKFPEFESEYTTSLKDALKDMGMPLAFDMDHADFSNMSPARLYIYNVIHKTYISVTPSGTRAAAVTMVEMDGLTAMLEEEYRYVMCDRPFAYAIVDTETGLPVFLGTVETV